MRLPLCMPVAFSLRPNYASGSSEHYQPQLLPALSTLPRSLRSAVATPEIGAAASRQRNWVCRSSMACSRLWSPAQGTQL